MISIHCLSGFISPECRSALHLAEMVLTPKNQTLVINYVDNEAFLLNKPRYALELATVMQEHFNVSIIFVFGSNGRAVLRWDVVQSQWFVSQEDLCLVA